MTTPKSLTIDEAVKAMQAGKKLVHETGIKGEFIYLIDDTVIFNNGKTESLADFMDPGYINRRDGWHELEKFQTQAEMFDQMIHFAEFVANGFWPDRNMLGAVKSWGMSGRQTPEFTIYDLWSMYTPVPLEPAAAEKPSDEVVGKAAPIPPRVFFIYDTKQLLNQYNRGEISLSKVVEVLNERATGISAWDRIKAEI